MVFDKDGSSVMKTEFKMPETEDEYYEALLQSADKRNPKNSHRELNRSRTERLKFLTKVINAMKRLPNADFIEELYVILLELIKFPDAEYQGVVLNAIKKTDKGGKIVEQYYPLLNKLISRESFKATLLELKQKIITFEDMEKDSIMPIANALLFRKLLDKKGTGNFKNFNSIREFVLDCVKNFREEDIDSMIKTIFSSFNCDVFDCKSVNVKKLVLELPIGRLAGLMEVINNVVRKLGPKLINYLPVVQEFILQSLELCNGFNSRYTEDINRLKKSRKDGTEESLEKPELKDILIMSVG